MKWNEIKQNLCESLKPDIKASFTLPCFLTMHNDISVYNSKKIKW